MIKTLPSTARGVGLIPDQGTKIPHEGFPGGSAVTNPLAIQETWIPSLGGEDPLEEEVVTHSSIIAWEIQWTEKPGRLHTVHGVTKELDMT